MEGADKGVLRLAIGLPRRLVPGLALPLPFVVCVMAVLVLSSRDRQSPSSRARSWP
jgi:hypothetical protein